MVRRGLCLRAGAVSAVGSACGQGLRTGAHLRCFPSHRCAAGPSRSRSHGRLRRPKSLPIRHSPAAAQCSPPLRWRDIPRISPGAASIRKFEPEIRNRCTDYSSFDLMAASIRKSGLEIKNRCTQEGLNGENLASILKFGPEIKNRCKQEGLNREKLASIRKFGPEIKNRCTQKNVSGEKLAAIPKFTPSNQESLHAGGPIPGIPCSDSRFQPQN